MEKIVPIRPEFLGRVALDEGIGRLNAHAANVVGFRRLTSWSGKTPECWT
jgi:hypothetical protein